MNYDEMQKGHENNVKILKQMEKDGKITNLKILGDLSTKLIMSWYQDGKLQEIVV